MYCRDKGKATPEPIGLLVSDGDMAYFALGQRLAFGGFDRGEVSIFKTTLLN